MVMRKGVWHKSDIDATIRLLRVSTEGQERPDKITLTWHSRVAYLYSDACTSARRSSYI